MTWCGLILRYGICALIATHFSSAEASIGKVLEVKSGANITSDGRRQRISAGMSVDTGDVIKTNKTGIVQLLFNDGTKIAVGPNSTMTVDASFNRRSNRASQFNINAIGGSFRFVSGNSRRKAYTVTTPTATMGVRGTIFDFWVLSDRQTSMAILNGSVRMCGSSGSCSLVRGSCKIAATTPRGTIGVPNGPEQASALLSLGFPFILSQRALNEQLHAPTAGCRRHQVPPNQAIFNPLITPPQPLLPFVQPPVPAPRPEPDPPSTPNEPELPSTPDEPEPPDERTGFPGQSGDDGPSQGRGGGVSEGQNGFGTGNGQGAATREENSNNNGGKGRDNAGGKNRGNANGHGNSAENGGRGKDR